MLARYQLIRGKRPADDPLPEGHRIDVRKHTNHVLRPDARSVVALLADPSDAAFARYRRDYLALLDRRFSDDRNAFDDLAALARKTNVYIGCNCPTKKQPDVNRCHTVLALEFMKEKYPSLDIRFPSRERKGRK